VARATNGPARVEDRREMEREQHHLLSLKNNLPFYLLHFGVLTETLVPTLWQSSRGICPWPAIYICYCSPMGQGQSREIEREEKGREGKRREEKRREEKEKKKREREKEREREMVMQEIRKRERERVRENAQR
ncbi:hypothetical protein, partial [Escherichia coli]|uniref:hypothetical protein n=1 Tax=Escherichia coli TaxID=562 RepID=UPI002574D25D